MKKEQMPLFEPAPIAEPAEHVRSENCALHGCFTCTSRRIQAASDAFEATGALAGREPRTFFWAVKEAGYTYHGYTYRDDGCPSYAWGDPKSQRCYAARATDWDGTVQGLRDLIDKQDSQWNKITGGLL